LEENGLKTHKLSLQKISLEVESEINQIESTKIGEDVFASTDEDLYTFKGDGTGLHKILNAREGIDQFSTSPSGKKLIYLSNGEFHICKKEGGDIRTIQVHDEYVSNVISFSIFPSGDRIVFVGESVEPDPKRPDIPVYRICQLDLYTEEICLLSKTSYAGSPNLTGWKGDDLLCLNNDLGDFLLLSTKSQSERPLLLNYFSLHKEGELESVAISHDGERIAFSVAYSDDCVEIFLKEMLKTRLIYPFEGEGGVRNALSWSPNCKWLSYTNSWFSSPTLYLLPIDSEKPKAIEAASLGMDSKVAWLPRGDGVAYSDGKMIHILKSQELVAK
jgi:Tol biopolymer transport system component